MTEFAIPCLTYSKCSTRGMINNLCEKMQSNIGKDGQGRHFREIRFGGRVQIDPIPRFRMGLLRFQNG